MKSLAQLDGVTPNPIEAFRTPEDAAAIVKNWNARQRLRALLEVRAATPDNSAPAEQMALDLGLAPELSLDEIKKQAADLVAEFDAIANAITARYAAKRTPAQIVKDTREYLAHLSLAEIQGLAHFSGSAPIATAEDASRFIRVELLLPQYVAAEIKGGNKGILDGLVEKAVSKFGLPAVATGAAAIATLAPPSLIAEARERGELIPIKDGRQMRPLERTLLIGGARGDARLDSAGAVRFFTPFKEWRGGTYGRELVAIPNPRRSIVATLKNTKRLAPVAVLSPSADKLLKMTLAKWTADGCPAGAPIYTHTLEEIADAWNAKIDTPTARDDLRKKVEAAMGEWREAYAAIIDRKQRKNGEVYEVRSGEAQFIDAWEWDKGRGGLRVRMGATFAEGLRADRRITYFDPNALAIPDGDAEAYALEKKLAQIAALDARRIWGAPLKLSVRNCLRTIARQLPSKLGAERRHWRERCLSPLSACCCRLRDTYRTIKRWEYVAPDGHILTADELATLSPEAWERCNVLFERAAEYPATEKARMLERTEKAKATRAARLSAAADGPTEAKKGATRKRAAKAPTEAPTASGSPLEAPTAPTANDTPKRGRGRPKKASGNSLDAPNEDFSAEDVARWEREIAAPIGQPLERRDRGQTGGRVQSSRNVAEGLLKRLTGGDTPQPLEAPQARPEAPTQPAPKKARGGPLQALIDRLPPEQTPAEELAETEKQLREIEAAKADANANGRPWSQLMEDTLNSLYEKRDRQQERAKKAAEKAAQPPT